MNITVRIRQVYGQDLIYPACNTSQAITRIKGSKTLTRRDVELLKGIGWEINVETPTL